MDSVVIARRQPFSSSAGVLLGASATLHVVSIVEAVFGTGLASGTAFLTGQFFASLALLRIYDGKWVFQDIRLFFVIFLFLYGGTLPLVVLSGFGSATEPGLAGAAFMFGTAFFGFNLVQWWYRQPWQDVAPEVFARIRPASGNTMMLAAALTFIVGYAVSRGVSVSLRIDRGMVGYLGGQLWVVMMFVINGLLMYMFAAWNQLTRTGRVMVVLSAILFVGFQLSMGNRRDFLPMLIFLVGVVATRRRAIIRGGTLILAAIAFTAFTALGIVRQLLQDPAMLLRMNPVEMVVTQNEFVSPIHTLMYYVTADRPLRWGFTYLSAPGLFVPRAIWPDKPESLSLQFMRDAFGTTGLMGFAYTPVTEAFLNFSWLGPFLVFAILSLIMVKLVRNASRHPGIYFVLFALVVDFNRGDFGGSFYAMLVVGGAYWLMTVIARLTWTPQRSARVWTSSGRGGDEALVRPG